MSVGGAGWDSVLGPRRTTIDRPDAWSGKLFPTSPASVENRMVPSVRHTVSWTTGAPAGRFWCRVRSSSAYRAPDTGCAASVRRSVTAIASEMKFSAREPAALSAWARTRVGTKTEAAVPATATRAMISQRDRDRDDPRVLPTERERRPMGCDPYTYRHESGPDSGTNSRPAHGSGGL